MKMKRLIATALAAAMIFGLVSVGFAAVFSDVEDHARKNDILKLVSLKIIDGYPDGTFKPENPVTRAEFAKLIVTTMGLGDAADLMAGMTPPFSDVGADHWASGYINLAHAEKIVNGYPDGTFKPGGNVTYAEALKMILCALGYTEDLIKPIYWPVTWISRAVNVGLTKGVSTPANVPATRGSVAALLENSLTIDKVVQTGLGGETKFEVKKGETFLKALVGAEPVTGILTASPELFVGGDKDSINVKDKDGVDHVFELLSLDDVKGLLGHKVKIWADSDAKVLFAEDLSTVKEGEYKEYTGADAHKTGVYVGSTKITTGAGAVPVIRNYGMDTVPTFTTDDQITVVYDGAKPIHVIAVEWDAGLVKSVSTLYRSIAFAAGRLQLDEDAVVTWHGAASALDEVEKDDVVQYRVNSDKTKAVVIVTRDTVEGTFTKLSGSTATIDGEAVKAYKSGVLDADDLGCKIKAFLNKDGKIFTYRVITAVSPENIALVLEKYTDAVWTVDGPKYYVKVVLPDGKKTTLEYEYTPTDMLAGVAKGDTIEYTLDKDNVISTPATILTDASTPVGTHSVSKKYKLVGSLVVTDGTVVFTYDSTKESGSVLTPDELLAKSSVDGWLEADGNLAKVVVIKGSAVDEDYGVITGKYKAYVDGSTKDYVSVLGKEGIVDYLWSASLVPVKGDTISFEAESGKIKVATKLTNTETVSDTVYEWRVSKIADNYITVKE